MKSLLRHALPPLAAMAVAAATSASASASPVTLPFSASYTGIAQVVEQINPVGPVLRFETLAGGSGSFDLASYFSTDVIDMSTGVGAGTNRFVAGNGDELYGSFTVQVIPTAVANIVELIGKAEFTGGTGLFSGASGSAQFTGRGEFTSPSAAVASLTYDGSISLVPEPGSALLLSAGIAALAINRRRRNGADTENEAAAAIPA